MLSEISVFTLTPSSDVASLASVRNPNVGPAEIFGRTSHLAFQKSK